jgi:hypothetical protein
MAEDATPDEYEGVDIVSMLSFLLALIEQATVAKVCYRQLNEALAIQVPFPAVVDSVVNDEDVASYRLELRLKTARVFLAVQGVLTAAARIEKLLWMSGPRRRVGCRCPPDEANQARNARAKRRVKALRKALGTPSLMYLLKRRVRDSLEYYDDGIERWLAFDPDSMTASITGKSIPLAGSSGRNRGLVQPRQ